MRVQDYLPVDFIADVAELVEYLLIDALLLRLGLRQKGQILLYRYVLRVQELFHGTHKLNELLGDGLEPGGSRRTCKHLDIAVDELCDFLDGVEGDTQVMLADEDVEDEVLVYAEDA